MLQVKQLGVVSLRVPYKVWENLIVFCHINEFHTLLRKSSHTYALHELSNLFKFLVYREIMR
jgi:hypothetical protein